VVGRLSPQNRHYLLKGDEEMQTYNVLAVVSIELEIDVQAESVDEALQHASEMDFSEVKPLLSDHGFQGVNAVDAEERG
jgi:hypothetical protein